MTAIEAAPLVLKVAPTGETMTWNAGIAYEYDGAGNVKKIGSDTHAYDAVGRLVKTSTNGVERTYEFDAFGNRTKCLQAAGTATETDCQYGLTVSVANNRMSAATYDGAGDVTSFSGQVYQYDALNMQTHDQSAAVTREYVYTADDERIATYTVGTGTWAWTVRNFDGKPLREFTSQDGTAGVGRASWRWKRDYVWRGDLLLASRHPLADGSTKTYHYHLDHLGSPRRVTDGNDRIAGFHDYFAFGAEITGGRNESPLSPLKYTGHERDLVPSESVDTLDHMHARYYSPAMGRFLSVDPVLQVRRAMRNPQMWNRYSYALNNSMVYTGHPEAARRRRRRRGCAPAGGDVPRHSSVAG